jgi:hypothetical protein
MFNLFRLSLGMRRGMTSLSARSSRRSMHDFLDAYSRRARILPGLDIMLPFSLLFVVLVTSHPHWWVAVVSVVSASGLTYLGAQIVRSLGQAAEIELWQSWGGPPTTLKLRFEGCRNVIQMERLHRRLRLLFPDEHLPTGEEEKKDSARADLVYETLVAALKARTRDTKQFARIFDENCQYGYRRNLYACRKFGYAAVSPL